MGTSVEQAKQEFSMFHAGVDNQQRKGLRLGRCKGEVVQRSLVYLCGFAHAAFLFVCVFSEIVGSFVYGQAIRHPLIAGTGFPFLTRTSPMLFVVRPPDTP